MCLHVAFIFNRNVIIFNTRIIIQMTRVDTTRIIIFDIYADTF